jgi:hypothetical protein
VFVVNGRDVRLASPTVVAGTMPGVPDVSSPPVQRYRCTSCGNLTRFDVTETRRTRSFHHFTVGGELSVERTEVLALEVEAVECTWCGPSGAVEPLPPAD